MQPFSALQENNMTTTPNKVTTQFLNKVPEVTLFFWVIKIMATTVGETAADFLNVNMNLGLTATSLVMGAILLAFLLVQIRSKRYVPAVYWVTVVLLSVFGTLITDNLVDNLGVSLATCTSWYASEKTLSIHSIYTTRRELFYWAAIFFTFALGTAAGDLAAEGLHLGYAVSVLVFGGVIGAVTLAHYAFRFNAIAAFWIAYILTRPLGASFGDLLAKPASDGGIGLGTVWTSAIFLVTIVALLAYLSANRKKLNAQHS